MKKFLYAFAPLMMANLYHSFGEGGGSLQIMDKSNMERLAFDGLDNYDDGDNFSGSNRKSGIYTLDIVNSSTSNQTFYLYNGQIITESLMNGIVIPALTIAVPGTSTSTTAGFSANAISAATIKEGVFNSINFPTQYNLTGSGSPSRIESFLTYLLHNPGNKLNGILLTSSAGSNHSQVIEVGERNPFKSQDDMLAPIDIKSFRRPTDFDQTYTMVKTNITLGKTTLVKMTIVGSSSMNLKLFMNVPTTY